MPEALIWVHAGAPESVNTQTSLKSVLFVPPKTTISFVTGFRAEPAKKRAAGGVPEGESWLQVGVPESVSAHTSL